MLGRGKTNVKENEHPVIVVTLWRWRKLVVALARREFAARHAGSALGAAWAVLEPIIQFLLYFTVFSVFLGMKLEGVPGVGTYAIYLISGLVPFLAFQESVMRAAGLLRSSSALVRHVNVPLVVLLAGAFGAVFTRHAATLLLAVAAAVLAGTVSATGLLWLLPGILLLAVGTFGVALVLLPAGAYLPDLLQLLGTATTVLFFLTPIVYPVSQLPPRVAPWFELNPLVGMLETFRAALLGTPVGGAHLAVSIAAACAAAVLGNLVYTRRCRAVRDLV